MVEVYYMKRFEHRWTTMDSRDFPFISLSRSSFSRHWKKLPIKFAFNSQPENVFMLLNVDSNPMSRPENQKWLRDNDVHHTSMSAGDIVRLGNIYYIALGIGFAKIQWVK